MPRNRGRRGPLVALADFIDEERELFCEVLGGSDFAVALLPAAVEAAVRRIRELQPALVVSRVGPYRFGIDLVTGLRRDSATRPIPTLLVTSYPLPRLQADARAAGADEVILLPILPEDLCAIAWGMVNGGRPMPRL